MAFGGPKHEYPEVQNGEVRKEWGAWLKVVTLRPIGKDDDKWSRECNGVEEKGLTTVTSIIGQ